MKIIEISNSAELAPYESAWNTLQEACGTPMPSQTFPWISSILSYDSYSNHHMFCLLFFDSDELKGSLLLFEDKRFGRPGYGIQVFRTLVDPFHTVRAEPLFRPGQEHVIEHLINHLAKSRRMLPVILIKGIPESGPTRTALRSGAIQVGWTELPAGQEDFLKVDGDFSEWKANLRSKFRRELDRQLRKLRSQSETRFQMCDHTRNCRENMKLFAEIEDSGWKGADGTSIRQHRHDFDLFVAATGKFDESNQMEWNFLNTETDTIAGQLAVRLGKTVFLWKIGYREAWSKFAPSNLLLYRLIETLHARPEISELNFMNERSWLTDFCTEKRKIYDLIVFPPVQGISLLLQTGLFLFRCRNYGGKGFRRLMRPLRKISD